MQKTSEIFKELETKINQYKNENDPMLNFKIE
jgi:hypothetical protein